MLATNSVTVVFCYRLQKRSKATEERKRRQSGFVYQGDLWGLFVVWCFGAWRGECRLPLVHVCIGWCKFELQLLTNLKSAPSATRFLLWWKGRFAIFDSFPPTLPWAHMQITR